MSIWDLAKYSFMFMYRNVLLGIKFIILYRKPTLSFLLLERLMSFMFYKYGGTTLFIFCVKCEWHLLWRAF